MMEKNEMIELKDARFTIGVKEYDNDYVFTFYHVGVPLNHVKATGLGYLTEMQVMDMLNKLQHSIDECPNKVITLLTNTNKYEFVKGKDIKKFWITEWKNSETIIKKGA